MPASLKSASRSARRVLRLLISAATNTEICSAVQFTACDVSRAVSSASIGVFLEDTVTDFRQSYMPPPNRRSHPPSPVSPARVVRRASLARSTRRSPQVFPSVTRSTYKHLPDDMKHRLLGHAFGIMRKLKRDLGEDWQAQIMPDRSPGSTIATGASGAASPAGDRNAPAAAGVGGATQSPTSRAPRRHPHASAFWPSPTSPGVPAEDPSRDGTERRRALWPSPIPWHRL